jgi:hypothetical protein
LKTLALFFLKHFWGWLTLTRTSRKSFATEFTEFFEKGFLNLVFLCALCGKIFLLFVQGFNFKVTNPDKPEKKNL